MSSQETRETGRPNGRPAARPVAEAPSPLRLLTTSPGSTAGRGRGRGGPDPLRNPRLGRADGVKRLDRLCALQAARNGEVAVFQCGQVAPSATEKGAPSALRNVPAIVCCTGYVALHPLPGQRAHAKFPTGVAVYPRIPFPLKGLALNVAGIRADSSRLKGASFTASTGGASRSVSVASSPSQPISVVAWDGASSRFHENMPPL